MDAELKISGLARSLDRTKEKINALEKELFFTKAIALSADRLANSLSERIDSVKNSVSLLQTQQQQTDGKVDQILVKMNSQFRFLLLFIIAMFGVFFGLAQWMK